MEIGKLLRCGRRDGDERGAGEGARQPGSDAGGARQHDGSAAVLREATRVGAALERPGAADDGVQLAGQGAARARRLRCRGQQPGQVVGVGAGARTQGGRGQGQTPTRVGAVGAGRHFGRRLAAREGGRHARGPQEGGQGLGRPIGPLRSADRKPPGMSIAATDMYSPLRTQS
jgi:hypothetical protein